MNKILLAVTAQNQSWTTKECLKTASKLDVTTIILDDKSTDDTVDFVTNNYPYIKIYSNTEIKGLTYSWNLAYKLFKDSDYDYLILSGNDILIPVGAIEELTSILKKWPGSTIGPLTTRRGCGHNPEQNVEKWFTLSGIDVNDPLNYQQVQDIILLKKKELVTANNLYQVDPVRMKYFNGFLFMMNRKVIDYERPDGNLFDPVNKNVGNEDQFNWSSLIPNNDFPFLCKTAYIYHYKGVTVTPEQRIK